MTETRMPVSFRALAAFFSFYALGGALGTLMSINTAPTLAVGLGLFAMATAVASVGLLRGRSWTPTASLLVGATGVVMAVCMLSTAKPVQRHDAAIVIGLGSTLWITVCWVVARHVRRRLAAGARLVGFT